MKKDLSQCLKPLGERKTRSLKSFTPAMFFQRGENPWDVKIEWLGQHFQRLVHAAPANALVVKEQSLSHCSLETEASSETILNFLGGPRWSITLGEVAGLLASYQAEGCRGLLVPMIDPVRGNTIHVLYAYIGVERGWYIEVYPLLEQQTWETGMSIFSAKPLVEAA